jgi:hypothetical protein
MVSQEFLNDHDALVILPKLGRFTLAEHLRDLPSEPVIVTNSGLKRQNDGHGRDPRWFSGNRACMLSANKPFFHPPVSSPPQDHPGATDQGGGIFGHQAEENLGWHHYPKLQCASRDVRQSKKSW